MSFKDQIAKDNEQIFVNSEEFADIHNINGKQMSCIVDSNELVDRERKYRFNKSQYSDGVYMKEVLIYVKASEFGKLPAIGRILILDGKQYTVGEAIDEGGIYSIILEANRA